MALRLAARYPKQYRFWRFSVDDYYGAHPTVSLGDMKKKFESITGNVLDELIEAIEHTGKIGSQEEIIDQLAEDLLEELHGKMCDMK